MKRAIGALLAAFMLTSPAQAQPSDKDIERALDRCIERRVNTVNSRPEDCRSWIKSGEDLLGYGQCVWEIPACATVAKLYSGAKERLDKQHKEMMMKYEADARALIERVARGEK